MLYYFSWWRVGSSCSWWQVCVFLLVLAQSSIFVLIFQIANVSVREFGFCAGNCLSCSASLEPWQNSHGPPFSAKGSYFGTDIFSVKCNYTVIVLHSRQKMLLIIFPFMCFYVSCIHKHREVFLDFDLSAVSRMNEKKIVAPGSPAISLLSELRLRSIIENARQTCKVNTPIY